MSELMLASICVLWLLWVAGAFVFGNAPHMNPWEFFLPSADPLSWISPAAVFGTPLLMLVSRFVPSRASATIGFIAVVLLLSPMVLLSTAVIFGL